MFRFKEFINDNDIKQRELMELFSVSQPYVSNLVNGKMPLQDDKIEILRKKYGDIVDGYKTDNDIVRANGVEAKWVPLVPILAMGGSLNEFNQGIGNMDCEKIISPVKDVDIAITIAGDSMAPEYPNGSIVFGRKINEKAFLEWGRVFVLDTCNGVVIKAVMPSERENCIKCVSLNSDPKYAPFDVEVKDIYGYYQIKLCMSKK